MKTLSKILGFSIIEFMIAMTLGTLIVAGAGFIFITSKNNHNSQEALARLQENARYAGYFLNHELRMAGYQGCASEKFVTMNNLIKTPPLNMISNKAIQGYEGSSTGFSPLLPANLTGLVPDSDVIEIRMASESSVKLRSDMGRTNNPILVYDRLGIQAGDILIITNCNIGDIFVAGANSNATAITHTNANNTSNNLSTPYTTSADLMRYTYYAFYIKDTGRKNQQNQAIYALIRQDVNGSEIEIAEGVERMKILYGVDSDDNETADSYKNASQIQAANQWDEVISIKINLLFTTVNEISPTRKDYRFNGATIASPDLKLHREFEIFVTLRNRGLPS